MWAGRLGKTTILVEFSEDKEKINFGRYILFNNIDSYQYLVCATLGVIVGNFVTSQVSPCYINIGLRTIIFTNTD